jgi:outer membrane protein assembly factor BamA
MKRPSFLFFTAFVLLAVSLPLAAQKFQPKTTQFKGDPEYSDQELLEAAGLKKGDILNFDEMSGHTKRLMDSGVFDTVSFKFDGVDLVLSLKPSEQLFPIRLENLPLAPGKELDAKLHDRFPLYHGKVPSEGTLLDGVRGALEEILAAKGIKATVEATPYTDQKLSQVTAMSFAITAPQVQMGEIHLEGVSPELQAKVKVVADRARNTSYDTENAASNIERKIALIYTDEGYATVKIHAAQSGDPVVSSEAIEIPFNVTVEEGRHYKLGSIRQPSGELLNLVDINKSAGAVSYKSGALSETLSVKGGLTLRIALAFVTGQYKSKGYMDCVVTPHPQYDDVNGIVDYTLEVEPGPVYTMGKLTIENSADDLRAAMQTAWKLPVGAVFSEKAINDYFYSQGNSALGRTFASANCRFKLAKNLESHTVDVTLRLERKQ